MEREKQQNKQMKKEEEKKKTHSALQETSLQAELENVSNHMCCVLSQ